MHNIQCIAVGLSMSADKVLQMSVRSTTCTAVPIPWVDSIAVLRTGRRIRHSKHVVLDQWAPEMVETGEVVDERPISWGVAGATK